LKETLFKMMLIFNFSPTHYTIPMKQIIFSNPAFQQSLKFSFSPPTFFLPCLEFFGDGKDGSTTSR